MPLLPTAKTAPKPNLADLTVLAYGQTKIGKSTFCSNSESAVFLATEPGLNSLDVFQVPIQTWDDLLEACAEIRAYIRSQEQEDQRLNQMKLGD